MNSPCQVSVVHLAYFVVFGGFSGVCRSFLLKSIERQGEFIYLILFKKSGILFHCAILSFVILNSIQCLVDRALNGPMCNTTPHT